MSQIIFRAALLFLSSLFAFSQAHTCEGVGFLPRELTLSQAKDYQHSGSAVDVHTFNRFYTFQVDRDVSKLKEGIEISLPPMSSATSLTLKFWFDTAKHTHVAMNMKVQLLVKETGTVLQQASTSYDASGVLDIDVLPLNQAMVLRYEFYEKQIMHATSSLAEQEDTIAEVSCNMPYFTQQLALLSQRVLEQRVTRWLDEPATNSVPSIDTCLSEFDKLVPDGQPLKPWEDAKVEQGFSCEEKTYYYKVAQQSAGSVIATKKFMVKGVENRAVTQFVQIDLGSEFVYSAGLTVLIKQAQAGGTTQDKMSNLECLYDSSCQLSRPTHKNHQTLDVILTSGEYIIEVLLMPSKWQQSGTGTLTEYLRSSYRNLEIPYSIAISATPVFQSEQRSSCPYMYLSKTFVQNKFIDEGQTQFSFKDKVIINLASDRQLIDIKPLADSKLKVVLHEAFGINALVSICTQVDRASSTCEKFSDQVGTTEILYASLKKGVSYSVKIEYDNSVVDMHSFSSCPHVLMELSMISDQERLELAAEIDQDAMDPNESDKKIKQTFKGLSNASSFLVLEDPKTLFSFKSDKGKEWERIHRSDFTVEVKRGLYFEVFYSPYFDEVLQIAVIQNSIDGSELSRALLKASKSLWIELDPANYSIEIMSFRSVDDNDSVGYETISYQLYLQFLPVTASREVFLPASLNYYGLLGFGQELQNFDSTTLFYDDLVLWHEEKQTKFTLRTKTLFAAKLQQDEPSTKLKLMQGKDLVGTYSSDVSVVAEQLITFELQPNVEYTLVMSKDGLFAESLLGFTESRDSDHPPFSLKLDFATVEGPQRPVKTELPLTIEQVAKVRHSVPVGLKESAFYMGSRDMLHLFDELIDKNSESPYEPKSTKVYQTTPTETGVILSLPFTVEQAGEVVYASLTDYSLIASLDLAIYSGETQEEIQIAEQGKYVSEISIQQLPQGTYYLVVKSNLNKLQVKFTLDVVRKIEQSAEKSWVVDFLEAIQMCPLPVPPANGFNKIGYLHALSGQTMTSIMDLSILNLGSGSNIPLRFKEPSLIIVYVEVPEEMQVALAIQQNGQIQKQVAVSSDQDLYHSNFIHQEGLEHRHIVELRSFVEAGSYWVSAQSVSYEDPNQSFDQQENPCQTFKMFVSVQPLISASELLQDEVLCESQIGLPANLDLHKMMHGDLISEINSLSMQVASIDTDKGTGTGPYLLYFQLDYDMEQEGVLALVLSRYDADLRTFKEVGLYSLMEGQAQIIQVIQKGNYVLSVQPVASTKHKFGAIGANVPQKIQSQCFKAKYTYMIDSIAQQDAVVPSFMMVMFGVVDQLPIDQQLLMLEAEDDLQDLGKFVACSYAKMPQNWPFFDFDHQLALKISQNAKDVSVLSFDTKSLLKIIVQPRNSKNKVSVRVQDSKGNVEASSDPGTGTLSAILEGQHQLVFVYDRLEPSDQCPLFDLRIAVTRIDSLPQENLECLQHELPPQHLSVSEANFKSKQTYAFSSDFLTEFANEDHSGLQYDITIDFAHSDYLLDVELRTDFPTNNLRMLLLAKDSTTKKYHRVAHTKWLNEQSEEEVITVPVDASQQGFIQRFQFIEDQVENKLLDSNTLIIRLVMGRHELETVQTLRSMGLLKDAPVCFNFELSIAAQQERKKGEPNSVRRVDVSPLRVDANFDIRERLVVYVFLMTPVENLAANSIYLQDSSQGVQSYVGKAFPEETKLKHDDRRVVTLLFKANTLDKGKCYTMKFGGNLKEIKYDYELCTSKCSCNSVGTSRCDESGEQPVCVCHATFDGPDCSKCAKGYALDKDGYCLRESLCADQGGTETCQNHGTCVQMGGIARCDCDTGFANEGLIQCGRCADPLFTYPIDCSQKRKWILQPTQIECEHLPYDMPRNLTVTSTGVQAQNGFLQWQGRYNLRSQLASHSSSSHVKTDQMRSRSVHIFKVEQPSTMRLYLSAPEAIVGLKYQIMQRDEVILSSDKIQSHFLEFDQIVPSLDGGSSEYKLVIEYITQPQTAGDTDDECPALEINFFVEALVQHQRGLKCTPEELKTAELVQNKPALIFEESNVQQVDVQISSSLEIYQNQLTSKEDEYFVYSTLKFHVTEGGNVFSAFASYRLADLTLYMSLTRVDDNKLVAVETSEVLDTVYDDVNKAQEQDMLAFLQVPNMQAGSYELTVSVPKGHWTYTRNFETCLGFKLVTEYWQRQQKDTSPQARVTGVYPSSRSGMQRDDLLELHLSLTEGSLALSKNEKILLTENVRLTQSENRFDICRLVNTRDSKLKITPTAVSFTHARALISFDFSRANKKDAQEFTAEDCYVLICEEPATKQSLFVSQQQHEYCFGSAKAVCNPFARAKMHADGSCICPEPYTGNLCESCMAGSESKIINKHTVCAPSKNDLQCNGFGQFRNDKCICDDAHTGPKCEKCTNDAYAYPDCSGDQKADVTSSKFLQSFDDQRREKVYIGKPESLSPFAQQCKQTDYPLTLNSIELHSQFATGNFHISDIYMVNHNTDNVIAFKPHREGLFKILVKQPELYSEQIETFDIQIGVYAGTEYVATEQNQEVKLSKKNAQGRLDYAQLDLNIDKSLVNQNLLIYFHATNFTQPEGADCQFMYLEMEFRSKETLPSCPSNARPLQTFDRRLTQLKLKDPAQSLTALDVQEFSEPVIYWQDFYVSEAETQLVLTLEQKFIEHKTIVPLVEVLAEHVSFEDFSYQLYRVNGDHPECKVSCKFIGHKSYNQFQALQDLEQGTVFRVWLVNVNTWKDHCFSFKLSVQLVQVEPPKIDEEPRCRLAPSMSADLNTDRYLGASGHQNDFRVTESAKLDSHNNFATVFTLKETTDVRVLGKLLSREYSIEILRGSKVMASSKLESEGVSEKIHSKPSVYVVLEAGEYKLLIENQGHKPTCGSISIDVSMQRFVKPQKPNQSITTKLDITNMLSTVEEYLFSHQAEVYSKIGYTELLNEEIEFEAFDGAQNLLMQVAGDSNIEFAIIKEDSNHVYLPQYQSENTRRLLIENVPHAAPLRLVIFSRNYATGERPYDSYFTASIKLFSYHQPGVSFVNYPGHSNKQVKQHKITQDRLACIAASDDMPTQLQPNTLLKLAVGPDFQTPSLFYYTHGSDSSLRVQMEEGFEISLKLNGKVIVTSQTDAVTLMSELVATDLKEGQKYEIELIKHDLQSFLWNRECRVITLITSSYREQPQGLLAARDKVLPSITISNQTEAQTVTIQSGQILPIIIPDKETGGDIDIEIDLSASLVTPQLHLASQDQAGAESHELDLIKSMLEQDDVQLQSDSFYSKRSLSYRYFDVPPGSYNLQLQAGVQASFKVTIKQGRALPKNKNQRQSEFYQSQIEDYQGVHKAANRLPLDLNSLQFLQKETEGYLLYSDLIQLHKDEAQNTITLKVDEDDTMLRIYTEDNLVQILHKLDGIEVKNVQNRKLFNKKLARGVHTITLAKVASPSSAIGQVKTQITLSVHTPSFLQTYQANHVEGLSECKQAQFPLALENEKTLQTDSENQAYYNYPHLRFPQSAAQQVTVHTYFFRYNETQRFYFEAGSHFLSNHITLKFSQMSREYMQSMNGKQRGNVNFIDTMIGAGDYQLKIVAYNSIVDQCGIYSIRALYNPITSMLLSTQGQALHAGSSSCELKGDFLPDVIYSSLSDTKGGNEDVILQDGSFLKYYNDVLVDTTYGPNWMHSIELEVTQKSIMQVTFVASETKLFRMKLLSTSGANKKPFHSDTVSTSAGDVKEVTLAWVLDPHQQYFLQVMHDSNVDEAELCKYFDLLMSVTSIDFLKKQHQCDNTKKKLLDVLPDKITQRQLPFNLTGAFRITYPEDFETLQGSKMVEGDLNSSLVIDTLIESDSEIEVTSRIWQVQSLSDFVLGLYEYPDKSHTGSLHTLATQSPTHVLNKNHLLGRSIPKTDLAARQKAILVLQERITYYTLSMLQKLPDHGELCLHIGLSLQVEQKQRAVAASVPTLKSFSFVGEAASGNTDVVRFEQTITSVNVAFEHGVPSRAEDVKAAFQLQLFNNDKSVLTFKADSVSLGAAGATLEFKPKLDSVRQLVSTSKQEWQVKLHLPENAFTLFSTSSQQEFKPSTEFTKQLSENVLTLKPAHNHAVIADEIKSKQSGHDTDSAATSSATKAADKAPVVIKCECVHGTCKTGERKCNKCENGWHGVLCDLPNKFQTASFIEDDQEQLFRSKKVSDSHVNEEETGSNSQRESNRKQRGGDSQVSAAPEKTKTTYEAAAETTTLWNVQSDVWQDQQKSTGGLELFSFDNFIALSCVALACYGAYWCRKRAITNLDQERRRQKRSDYEGILATEDENEDADNEVIPLELEVINRKQQNKAGKAKSQPQEQAAPPNQVETRAAVPEHSITNEIDNALAEFDDSDEENGYRQDGGSIPQNDDQQLNLDSDDDEFSQFI